MRQRFRAFFTSTCVVAGLWLVVQADRCQAQATQPGESPRPTTAPTDAPPPGREEVQTTGHAGPPEKSSEEKKNFWTQDKMTGDWFGLRPELAKIGLQMDLSYQQHYQQNYRGGLKTHNADRFTGSYDWVFQLDFKKMGLIPKDLDWESGFYIKTKGEYNRSIQEYVGSLSDPNADPGTKDVPIYVSKWWFWNKFFKNKLEFRLGVMEINKDLFDISLYANDEDKDFVNRWSIRNPTVPYTTAMGAFMKIQPVDWWYAQAAAVDAQAQRYHTQFDTAFHDKDWYLGFWETGFTPKWQTPRGPMPGRYRVGFWYNPTVKPVFMELEKDEEPDLRGHDMGFYAGLDQMVWKENDNPKDDQGLGLFTRYGGAHGDINRLSCYWELGASYKGLIPTRDRDVLGFAWSNGTLSDDYRNFKDPLAYEENVFEWYYGWQVTPWFIVSPDLQVIRNPGGDRDDHDAIIGGIRIRIIF